MRAKTGVKLAYKHAFALVFTSDGHPRLLVRPWPDKKMSRPEQLYYENSNTEHLKIQLGGNLCLS